MRRYPRETAESKLFDAVLSGIARLFSRKTPQRAVGQVSSHIDRGYVVAEWQRITESMRAGGESRFQQAVVNADKLLDYVLRSFASGETMGERLQNAERSFSSGESYQAAWNGHKLRNKLVHETNYQTVSWEAQETIRDFETALRGLGVL